MNRITHGIYSILFPDLLIIFFLVSLMTAWIITDQYYAYINNISGVVFLFSRSLIASRTIDTVASLRMR